MIFNRRRPQPAPEPDWDDPFFVPQPVERWIEPEEIVQRQRRRRGRWRALRHSVVLLLIILLVGGVGVAAGGAVLGRWDLPWSPDVAEQAAVPAAPTTDPTGQPLDCERAVVVPAAAQGTSVEVLNATDRNGLAGEVSDQLEERGFTVGSPGNYADTVAEPAVVLFPSGAEAAALAVAAHLQGAVLRPDDDVEVVTAVLGDDWTGIVEVSRAAEAAQAPQPSVVTCASGSVAEPPASVAPSAPTG